MFWKRVRLLGFFAGILLLLTACNFPGTSSQSTVGPEVIYTAAAQTLSAQQTQAAEGTPIVFPSPTSLVVILPTNTSSAPTDTPVPTNTPLPTATSVPPTPTEIPIPCDQAQFVKDVTVPDNTEIAAGATFVKTWRLKNEGSCTWTSGYALVFYNGDAMSGPASSQLTNGTVPPGSEVDVSVSLIAPATPGSFTGNWRLRNASGAVFGIGSDNKSFWVKIKSVAPTPTPSPTSAYTLGFDFVAKGPDAAWQNGTATIPWGDPPSDTPGVAVNVGSQKMEDGNTYSNLLATYPQLIQDGMVLGKYPAYTVQANDHLRTKIGLRYDCGQGNVKFQIRYIEGQTEVTIPGAEWIEKCDGAMTTIDINLANLAGHTVQFELVVLTNGSASDDHALWVAPRIEH